MNLKLYLDFLNENFDTDKFKGDPRNATRTICEHFGGLKEFGKNAGFTNHKNAKIFTTMMKSVGWRSGWAWCAVSAKLITILGFILANYDYFYDYACSIKTPGNIKKYEILKKIYGCFSPNSRRTFANFKKAGFPILNEPKPATIAVYKYTNTRVNGHVDVFVESVQDCKNFHAWGGNVSDMFKLTKRRLGSVRNREILGFIDVWGLYDANN